MAQELESLAVARNSGLKYQYIVWNADAPASPFRAFFAHLLYTAVSVAAHLIKPHDFQTIFRWITMDTFHVSTENVGIYHNHFSIFKPEILS